MSPFPANPRPETPLADCARSDMVRDGWATAASWTPLGICPETPGAKTGDADETLPASVWSLQAITQTRYR